jgi:hypothetical protein
MAARKSRISASGPCPTSHRPNRWGFPSKPQGKMPHSYFQIRNDSSYGRAASALPVAGRGARGVAAKHSRASPTRVR